MEPVDPNAPAKKRAINTVWMFFALRKPGMIDRSSVSSWLNSGYGQTYRATIKCISANATTVQRYSGCLPNSSLNEALTSGTMAKPKAYRESPCVAWKVVQLRSLVMESHPRGYVDAVAATELGTHESRYVTRMVLTMTNLRTT